jgi:hypothetical protein
LDCVGDPHPDAHAHESSLYASDSNREPTPGHCVPIAIRVSLTDPHSEKV